MRRQFTAQPDGLEGGDQFDPHLSWAVVLDRCGGPQPRAEGHALAELLAQGLDAPLCSLSRLIGARWNHGNLQIQPRQFTDQRGGVPLEDQFTQPQVESQLPPQAFDLKPLQPLAEQKLQHQNSDQPAAGQQAAPGADGLKSLSQGQGVVLSVMKM